MSQDDRTELPRAGVVGLTLAVAGLSVAIVYPWAIDFVLERVGVRATAFALAVFAALPLIARGPAAGRGRVAAVGFVAILATAALLDDRRALQLLPAWVYLGLAVFCLENAREDESILERSVRRVIPEAPLFIRGYCRVLTGLWGGFFGLSALAIAALACFGTPERWRAFTSREVWLAMAAVMVAEFFVRKTWFRYYFHNGPFERFWSRLFPAEATERGRRSLAYIEAYYARRKREASGASGAADGSR
jgi:uncharacterized membrane protein